jgi:phosphate starvation-inducible protein PhoH
MARTSAAKKVVDIHNEERESKPVANNQLKLRLDNLKTFQPLTDNQKLFYDAYKQGDYFIALHGVAGTGKTFIALYKAIEEVLDKSNPFNKIIVVRSAVQGLSLIHI